jgi:4-amino-4-deoxy-L-arabinose transferase-like glycosyltransferase
VTFVARAALVVFGVLLLSAAATLAPIQDEAYYWTWSRQPGLQYYDHPPGVAWLMAASTSIFGDGRVGLRLPSLISIGVCLGCLVAACRRIVGADARRRAQATRLAVLILLGSPMFVVGFLPATPDPYHGALAAIASYLAVRSLEPDAPPRFAFAAALAFSVAVLFKHYAALLAVGALAGLLATSRGRGVAKTWGPWAGVAFAFVLVGPWLIAEWGSSESSLSFQAHRVLLEREPRGVAAPLLMLGSLMGTLGVVTTPVLLWSCVLEREYRPLAWGALALLAGCLVAVWRGSGEANWATPALLVALPVVVRFAVDRPRLARVMVWSGVVSAVLMGLVLVHVVRPFVPLRSDKDPTLRGAGFSQLARRVSQARRDSGARLAVTHGYQAASLLRYHTGDQIPVRELRIPGRRKSQYDRWPRPGACQGESVVVLGRSAEFAASLGSVTTVSHAPRVAAGQPTETWWVSVVTLASDLQPCKARLQTSER